VADIFMHPSLTRGGLDWPREAGFPRVPGWREPERPWNVGRYAGMAPYETERAVFWVLTGKLGFVLNVDFFFQRRLPVRGINQTGLNRSDFWCLPSRKGALYGVGAAPYTRGRVLNPISYYTHRNPGKDDMERIMIRRQAHIDVQYLRDTQLFADPLGVVTRGLRGVDTSGH
jgi:hypothetical protein